MDILKESDQVAEIILRPEDVECAVRQFICDCHPEYSTKWVLNPKYNTGAVVFAATKGD